MSGSCQVLAFAADDVNFLSSNMNATKKDTEVLLDYELLKKDAGIANKSFKSKMRLNSGNVYRHSLHNILSSSFQSRNVKIKI